MSFPALSTRAIWAHVTFRSAPWKELTQKVIFLSGVEFSISCSFHRALGRKPVNLETVVGASSEITPVCAHPSLVFLNEGGWVLGGTTFVRGEY